MLSKALENRYIPGFPGLTYVTLQKFPPQSIAMSKGHLDQTRKNQRSTKSEYSPAVENDSNASLFDDDCIADSFPESPDDGNALTSA